MSCKKRIPWDEMDDAVQHAMDTMMGRMPKKALIIDGPMRSKRDMLFWLRLWKNKGPAPKSVMSKGMWFEGRANVDEYPSAVEWRRENRPRQGNCFQNAQQFCLAHPKARYFEGFYLIFESPDHHAWVVMEDGRVVDFTHEAVIRKLKREKGEVHVRPPLYFGLEIPHDALVQLHASADWNEPILELYKAGLKRRRR